MIFQRGNLQDAINKHTIDGTHFSEKEMLRLFHGTCLAIRAMHDFHAPLKSGATSNGNTSGASGSSSSRKPSRPKTNPRLAGGGALHSDDEEEDEMLPQPEGDADEGYSYDGNGNDGGSSIPLVTKRGVEEGEVVFDGDEELANNGFADGNANSGQTELVPYAHRDLKPGYVICFW